MSCTARPNSVRRSGGSDGSDDGSVSLKYRKAHRATNASREGWKGRVRASTMRSAPREFDRRDETPSKIEGRGRDQPTVRVTKGC